jgi:hypothetical protein
MGRKPAAADIPTLNTPGGNEAPDSFEYFQGAWTRRRDPSVSGERTDFGLSNMGDNVHELVPRLVGAEILRGVTSRECPVCRTRERVPEVSCAAFLRQSDQGLSRPDHRSILPPDFRYIRLLISRLVAQAAGNGEVRKMVAGLVWKLRGETKLPSRG